MKKHKIIIATMLAVPLLYLSACQSIPSYSTEYSQARNRIQGIQLNDAQASQLGQRFTSTFDTLGTAQFTEKATALYADELFINDTLSQFSSRAELTEHFKGLNQRVSNVSVTLLNTSFYNDSAYVHWHMAYDFKIFGTTRTMASHGISEMKINEQNQIIFQQDFWDPADGLFRGLPYVGAAYSWLLPFKKSP